MTYGECQACGNKKTKNAKKYCSDECNREMRLMVKYENAKRLNEEDRVNYHIDSEYYDPIAIVPKSYAKRYEDVYMTPRCKKVCDSSKISVASGSISLEEYESRIKEVFSDFNAMMWEKSVKYCWLSMNFDYDGNRMFGAYDNGIVIDYSFAVFQRGKLGVDSRAFSDDPFKTWYTMRSYVLQIYPDIGFGKDPWKEEFPFPFPTLGISCMYFVRNIPERLGLLEYGESKKMGILEFMDYVINYISCYNDEKGYKYYLVGYQKAFRSQVPSVSVQYMRIIANEDIEGWERVDCMKARRVSGVSLRRHPDFDIGEKMKNYLENTKPRKYLFGKS